MRFYFFLRVIFVQACQSDCKVGDLFLSFPYLAPLHFCSFISLAILNIKIVYCHLSELETK